MPYVLFLFVNNAVCIFHSCSLKSDSSYGSMDAAVSVVAFGLGICGRAMKQNNDLDFQYGWVKLFHRKSGIASGEILCNSAKISYSIIVPIMERTKTLLRTQDIRFQIKCHGWKTFVSFRTEQIVFQSNHHTPSHKVRNSGKKKYSPRESIEEGREQRRKREWKNSDWILTRKCLSRRDLRMIFPIFTIAVIIQTTASILWIMSVCFKKLFGEETPPSPQAGGKTVEYLCPQQQRF